MDRRAACHPGRVHAALGLCRPCYMHRKNRANHLSLTHAPLVYFVAHEPTAVVKIGTTNNLATRLRQLQAGSPVPLSVLFCIPGGRAIERELHTRFATSRTHGEWFKLTAIESDLLEIAAKGTL